MKSYFMHLMVLLSIMIRSFSTYENTVLLLLHEVFFSAFDAISKIIL